MKVNGQTVQHLIELRGVHDGWSVAVLEDGTLVNRWSGIEGYERRAGVVDAFIAGEEPNGRWF